MRLGINSPVVTAVPGVHSPWERAAGIEELGAVAETADRLGFDHLTCSEHVAVPVDIAGQRGGTYWDPLSVFGYLAARTDRIRFATQVLVLGYHHPLEIAKRYGTLDRVCGGRVVLGLGVGSLEEEFQLLGAAFEGRGAIADDALAALRASLSRREPAYHGEHFDYEGLVVEPHAVQDRVPLWIGGRTPRSLRRAVAYGDGWVPFGLPLERLGEMVGAASLPDGFEVVLSAGRPLDPSGDPDGASEALRKVSAAGATLVSASLTAGSASHYAEQLEALAAIAGLTAGAEARV
ncbi:TIGR03619 family F420-dependent LLM class oxidoreductase [Streptomyces sp. P01-B04]|uniref:TIGR03619 family F420-dependent LLM class oxidoreductase n=1 Tax=Streptomyces poriferorum TaxID=2798799 RepID=A0ABY9J085_9ACTN|nr:MULTISPECIES: TIGR03619 family F420-dependent LLM class oxidoreductase [Streptomyces]MBW5253964.1 TIGR03619 family F420-dependent LLM class oxidoreductase [Streptomyces poriferorum]MBW5261546.1 TIGR03619 family F420-dependent LLM class oxidoreductase [Streptomyces poriferorum]MDP5310522.1 TIGR03619 family F420-dependent LLM class oxidoreductase [Streptomyces sp. Alt4]WLQ60324.1 TIGR03619 family F420-dependent LLM class oxidoreductase [Streptomyces sp. Alt2]